MSSPASHQVELQFFFSRHVTPRLPHRALCRLTRGRVGARFPGARPRVPPLNVSGRHSGKARTTPLMYFELEARLVMAATNSGYDREPQWCRNLRANPEAEVQVRPTKRGVRAREADGDERQRLWAAMTQMHPLLTLVEARTQRRIPVWVLEPKQD